MEGELEVVDPHATWRNCVRDVLEEGWQEKMRGKSSLKWYRFTKEEFGQERYMKELVSKREVRVIFRLRIVSAGLLDDKERCCM